MPIEDVGDFHLSRSLAAPFVILAVGLVLCTSALVGFMQYVQTRDLVVAREGERLLFASQQISRFLDDALAAASRNVIMLAGTPPIEGIMASRRLDAPAEEKFKAEEVWRDRLGRIFLSLAQTNADIMQIRLIDISGAELVRVNNVNGDAWRVDNAHLQDKSGRAYVEDSIGQPRGSVRFFGINLNRELGVIQTPQIPVMRVTVPAYGRTEDKQLGLIVINVNMMRVMTRIYSGVHRPQLLYITNERGDYVMHPDRDMAFGFERADPHRLQDDYPQFAQILARPRTGEQPDKTWELQTDETIARLIKQPYGEEKDHRFFVIAMVTPMAALLEHNRQIRDEIILVTSLLAMIGAVIAILSSEYLIRPLFRLTKATHDLANGAPASSIQMTGADRRDEIGILVRSVLGMATSLQEKQEHIKTIVETASNPILVTTRDGVVTDANKATTTLLGYERDELIGANVAILMDGYHRSHHGEYLARYHKNKVPRIIGLGMEVEARHKDGRLVPVHLAVSEISLNDTIYYTGIMTDLTELKKVDKLKSEFVSTVSHELRTPLTSIKGALSLLQSDRLGVLSEGAKKIVSIAHTNTDRLVRLINDILDIEKIEAGKVDFAFKSINVAALMQGVVDANQTYAMTHGTSLRLAPVDPTLSFVGDRDRIEQVLVNLISNAVKFSAGSEAVDLNAKAEGERVVIAVRDYGGGIPEDFKDKIFGKFAQADSSDARVQGGTGLGLAISKRIVLIHGGDIDFTSRAGEGTTFTVRLRCEGPEGGLTERELAADKQDLTDAAETPAWKERNPDTQPESSKGGFHDADT